uniref:Uncharacterized protein n=1 Tax=Cynoglossus semilaevis TaxID=244447 RepID=A0A3P8UGU0_CYNSE
ATQSHPPPHPPHPPPPKREIKILIFLSEVTATHVLPSPPPPHVCIHLLTLHVPVHEGGRERGRERGKHREKVCVCVCVRERERDSIFQFTVETEDVCPNMQLSSSCWFAAVGSI